MFGHDEKPDPRKKTATLEDIQPTLDEIIMNVRSLGEPGSSFYIRHSDDAYKWADVIENHTSNCCASHKVDELAHLQIEMMEILHACEHEDCPFQETHEFIRGLIDSIDKPMSRLMRKLKLEQMLHERTN